MTSASRALSLRLLVFCAGVAFAAAEDDLQPQRSRQQVGHVLTGKLVLPEGSTSPSRVQLVLTLDGGNQQLSWARPDSSFRFHEVPAGSHLLDVVAMGLIFPQVRLDVDDSGRVTASLVDHPLTLMPRPLLLRPLAKAEYFEVRQPFNPKAFLMSPMGLALAFGVFSLVVMPMLKMDPEEVQEVLNKKEGDAKRVQQSEKPQLQQRQSRAQKKQS